MNRLSDWRLGSAAFYALFYRVVAEGMKVELFLSSNEKLQQ